MIGSPKRIWFPASAVGRIARNFIFVVLIVGSAIGALMLMADGIAWGENSVAIAGAFLLALWMATIIEIGSRIS